MARKIDPNVSTDEIRLASKNPADYPGPSSPEFRNTPSNRNTKFTKAPSGLWTPQYRTAVANRYVRGFEQTSDAHLALGAQFYPAWNETAEWLGDRSGTSTAAGSAALAHLSPSNEAELNRVQGIQMGVQPPSSKQLRQLQSSANYTADAKRVRNQITSGVRSGRIEAGSSFHAQLEDEVAGLSEKSTRSRLKAGIEGPMRALGSQEVVKSHHALYESDDPLGTLRNASGHEVKLYDFGNMINDEDWTRPPIDTHIHDAGLDQYHLPFKGTERGLEAVSRYTGFQGAMDVAHQRAAPEIRMSHFMGGLWYGHQQRKMDVNPNARAARVASETRFENMRNDPAMQPFLPDNYGLAAALPRITVR